MNQQIPEILEPPEAEKNPEIRLVAIDLDGTLLNDSKQISQKTISALCDLPARGVKVIIASARPPRSVRHIYTQLKLDTWQINYNGALIWDEQAKRAIYHRPMQGQMARKIIDAARATFQSIVVSCEILDQWYTDRPEQPYTTETGRLFKPDLIGTLDQLCAQPVTKLLLLDDAMRIKWLESILAADFADSCSIVRADPELIQIMDRGVSKATALQKVAEHYGFTPSQIMAIGDAPNDVGMLQLAGVAVAMDNAHEIVKRVSHWVAPSNNDHGVHAALVKYGLCG